MKYIVYIPFNACDCVLIDATLIAITTGVIVAIGGALIGVVIGIICYRKYKNRRGKGKLNEKMRFNNYDDKSSISFPFLCNRPC